MSWFGLNWYNGKTGKCEIFVTNSCRQLYWETRLKNFKVEVVSEVNFTVLYWFKLQKNARRQRKNNHSLFVFQYSYVFDTDYQIKDFFWISKFSSSTTVLGVSCANIDACYLRDALAVKLLLEYNCCSIFKFDWLTSIEMHGKTGKLSGTCKYNSVASNILKTEKFHFYCVGQALNVTYWAPDCSCFVRETWKIFQQQR